uniref:ANK_REP_REGION domain-containing protein n=1 Tax=Loa loa TaxID=7209 RepID=A0A1I7VT63_LOALO
MMTDEKGLRREYPLHWAVFRNDYENLMILLEEEHAGEIVNKLDVRGRTPLMLAITLGHYECARALLEKGANAAIQNADMWSPSHEAICAGNSDLLRLIIQHRDYQRALQTSCAMERLLTLLKKTGDFYVEMGWEFTSWLPFVSKMCPSDTYKIEFTCQLAFAINFDPNFDTIVLQIYKRGSNVRIDTTLVGFDITSNWKRGNQSFIFRFTDNHQAQLIVLEHDSKTATIHTMDSQSSIDLRDFIPPEEAVYSRMTSPVDTTFIDIEKIGFERSKGGGLFSWLTSSDRVEEVAGYECKVFNASNVDIVTKTRTEHLLEGDKERFRHEEHENPLYRVLKLAEKHQKCTSEMRQTGSDVYCGLTAQQYLDKNYSMNNRDIGLPKQVTKKTSSFKATLWLCDHYPLDLQDQVLPVIDLMAVNNVHFARLKNFIQLQLPAGFPVKIEIPLFHVVSARITFSAVNIPGPYLSYNVSSNEVEFDPTIFEIPKYYRSLNNGDYGLCINGNTTVREISSNGNLASRRYVSEDELYLQFALEQSMREAAGPPTASANACIAASVGAVSDWHGDTDLAYAIDESIRTLRLEQLMREGTTTIDDTTATKRQTFMDDDIQLAIRLSKKDEEERLKACEEQEEELERIIKLSLIEK